jgi:hypothetical protein
MDGRLASLMARPPQASAAPTWYGGELDHRNPMPRGFRCAYNRARVGFLLPWHPALCAHGRLHELALAQQARNTVRPGLALLAADDQTLDQEPGFDRRNSGLDRP